MGLEELKSIPLFKDISEGISGILSPLAKEEHYEAGNIIFEEGSPADRFFIVKEGEIEIRKVIDRHGGRYKPIAILPKGEFFGEMAVFLGQSRSADAVAKTGTTLAAVSKKDLSVLFSHNPEAALKVMEFFTSVLMDRLKNTTDELAAIYETGRLITTARSISELSDYVMEGVLRAVEPEAGLFVVWSDFNREFEVINRFGFEDEISVVPEEDPLIKWLMENKEPFLSFDLKSEGRLQISARSIYKGISMVASPFLSQDRLLGFMLFLQRTKHRFSYNQMILLSAISVYVSVAVENLKHMQEDLDRSRLSQAKSSIPF